MLIIKSLLVVVDNSISNSLEKAPVHHAISLETVNRTSISITILYQPRGNSGPTRCH